MMRYEFFEHDEIRIDPTALHQTKAQCRKAIAHRSHKHAVTQVQLLAHIFLHDAKRFILASLISLLVVMIALWMRMQIQITLMLYGGWLGTYGIVTGILMWKHHMREIMHPTPIGMQRIFYGNMMILSLLQLICMTALILIVHIQYVETIQTALLCLSVPSLIASTLTFTGITYLKTMAMSIPIYGISLLVGCVSLHYVLKTGILPLTFSTVGIICVFLVLAYFCTILQFVHHATRKGVEAWN